MSQLNLKSIVYSRYPYILLTGVSIALILRKIAPGSTYESPFLIDFITATTITWLAWEGSFYINKAMEKKWSFIEHAFKYVYFLKLHHRNTQQKKTVIFKKWCAKR